MNMLKSLIRIVKSLLLAIILICLVIFMVNNREIVNLSFNPLPFVIEARVFILVIFFFFLGVVCGSLSMSRALISKAISAFGDGRKIKKLQKTVEKDKKA